MSRIYRALEKAESRKGQKAEEDSILQIFGEKNLPPAQEPISKSIEGRIKKVEFPAGNGSPLIIPPPHSYIAEQFRKLKTHILNQSPAPRSILITSAIPGEGKSMVALNLALSFAQETHFRTILVDADLRKPSIFPELSSEGLSDYLAGQTSWEEILIRFEAQNLFVIPAGKPSLKAPELLGSPKMRDLLKTLLQRGEDTFVFIDAPPILVTSEPLIFSNWVDGILLVVMSDLAPRSSVRKALETIGQEKIIGAIFNQINLKPSKHHPENYYRYYRKYFKD
jgi:receptor protein-tyrosine kinase/non-specific protein-tyrosine kinase